MKKIKDYKNILFDLDNTLLDFSQAEDYAIRKLANDFNIDLTFEEVKKYVEINNYYWHLCDSGQMEKKEILKLRFVDFFKLFNIEVDGQECDNTYRTYLCDNVYLVENCKEVLEELYKDHNLYIASNGVKSTQYIRLEKAGITKYFKNIFLSEEIGYSKPSKEYFDYVKKHIDFTPDNTIMIGDSLFADINGAINSNIVCAYFNHKKQENSTNYQANYEILNLKEILK